MFYLNGQSMLAHILPAFLFLADDESFILAFKPHLFGQSQYLKYGLQVVVLLHFAGKGDGLQLGIFPFDVQSIPAGDASHDFFERRLLEYHHTVLPSAIQGCVDLPLAQGMPIGMYGGLLTGQQRHFVGAVCAAHCNLPPFQRDLRTLVVLVVAYVESGTQYRDVAVGCDDFEGSTLL